jgi:diguanylate cyclase (GGDEF)-like protein
MNTTPYSKKLYYSINTIAFVFIIIISAIAFMSTFAIGSTQNVFEIGDGWTDIDGAAIDITNIKGTVEITKYIDVKGNNNTIIYRARNCYTDIYVNDELISPDEIVNSKIIGMSPGSRWHVVTLPPSDEPLKLGLVVSACYDNSHATIDNFYIGEVMGVYKKITSLYLFGFLTCVFLQVLSLIVMVVYLYLKKLFNVSKNLLYLGVTAFFTAQWAACESLIGQLLIGHSGFFHIMGYLSLVVIPLCFGLYGASRLNGKLALFAKCYSIAAAINVIVSTLLHITGIFEFHYTLINVHVLLIILIPVLTMLVLSYRNERTTVYYMLIPIAIFISCIVIAIFKYVTGQYSSYTFYIRIALVSFLFCLIIYQANEIAITFSKGLKADMLHDMALSDHMTGLYNRTALNEHSPEYDHIIASYSPLGIIQFDVNNLKRVNDTMGHEMGDKLISAAAAGLKLAFKENCNIYRTGGDEFLIIINALDPTAVYESGIKKLKNYCDKYNNQPDLPFKLIIAHGFVTIKGNTTLSEAIDMADVLMYQDKRELKATEKSN